MSAPVFYFANRDQSKFKFDLNSNQFAFIEKVWKIEKPSSISKVTMSKLLRGVISIVSVNLARP
jgi:hypothetical protein